MAPAGCGAALPAETGPSDAAGTPAGGEASGVAGTCAGGSPSGPPGTAAASSTDPGPAGPGSSAVPPSTAPTPSPASTHPPAPPSSTGRPDAAAGAPGKPEADEVVAGGGGQAGPADGQSPGSRPEEPAARPAPRSQEADDAAFLDLIAHFDDEPDTRRWPAAEDLGDTRRPTVIILRPPFEPGVPPAPDDRTDPGLDEAPPPPGLNPPGIGGGRGADPADFVVIDLGGSTDAPADPEDDHYVPPPAPPLPRIRPVTRWALGSIALGVVFLVVPTLIGFNQSRAQDVTGVLLILGGVGTLVARMGDRPPTDVDGPDDGAVI